MSGGNCGCGIKVIYQGEGGPHNPSVYTPIITSGNLLGTHFDGTGITHQIFETITTSQLLPDYVLEITHEGQAPVQYDFCQVHCFAVTDPDDQVAWVNEAEAGKKNFVFDPVTGQLIGMVDENGFPHTVGGTESTVTNTVPGNPIAIHDGGSGPVIINETITSITVNEDGQLVYTDEEGTPNPVDLPCCPGPCVEVFNVVRNPVNGGAQDSYDVQMQVVDATEGQFILKCGKTGDVVFNSGWVPMGTVVPVVYNGATPYPLGNITIGQDNPAGLDFDAMIAAEEIADKPMEAYFFARDDDGLKHDLNTHFCLNPHGGTSVTVTDCVTGEPVTNMRYKAPEIVSCGYLDEVAEDMVAVRTGPSSFVFTSNIGFSACLETSGDGEYSFVDISPTGAPRFWDNNQVPATGQYNATFVYTAKPDGIETTKNKCRSIVEWQPEVGDLDGRSNGTPSGIVTTDISALQTTGGFIEGPPGTFMTDPPGANPNLLGFNVYPNPTLASVFGADLILTRADVIFFRSRIRYQRAVDVYFDCDGNFLRALDCDGNEYGEAQVTLA